jgi:hypothetical protein
MVSDQVSVPGSISQASLAGVDLRAFAQSWLAAESQINVSAAPTSLITTQPT